MEIYLDNSATTRCFPEVAQYMTQILCEDYGNPASLHRKGVEAEQHLRRAKETLSEILKVNERELLFTSGGTESDNLVLIGACMAGARRGRHVITTRIEHPAVLQTAAFLESQGFRVTYLPVDQSGLVRPEDLERALTPDTLLVSIMHVNNEIGSLQPIEELGALIKSYNPEILFHVDGVQSFGKLRILPKRMNVDLFSASSHKIHGPKGVGMLYVRDGVRLQPIMFGGGQQKNLRSGTENVPGVSGMALAAKMLYGKLEEDTRQLYGLKRMFIAGLSQIEGVRVNGLVPGDPFGERSAPHIVSASFAGVRSEVLLHALEDKGIYVSAGSACAAHKPQTSETLKEIGLPRDLWDSTLRFSFSVFTTREELDITLETLREILPMLRRFRRK